MKKTYITTAIASLLALTSSMAIADGSNLYVSVTGGESEFDSGLNSGPGYSVDETDTTWSINLGYNMNEYFAVEVGYRDLGEASITATNNLTTTVLGSNVTINAGSAIKAEADGFTLGLLGKLPINESFDITAKVGTFIWDADVSATGSGTIDGTAYAGSYSVSDDDLDVYGAIGAQYNFNNNFALGAQWIIFEVLDEDIDAIEATLSYSF